MSIIFEKQEGVARITIDRPPLNILDIKTIAEVNEALESVQSDLGIKVIVITGKGKAFSVGVDVKDHTADKVDEMIGVFHRMFRLLAALPQPTLAVVNGAALGGGCELAVFCDLVIASETASFGQPEIKVGVVPPIAAFSLPRLIGRKRAIELILTGDTIDAQEAWRMGLVNQVVPEDKLGEATDNLVQKLVCLSGIAVRLSKRAIYHGLDTDFEQFLGKVEDLYLNDLMQTIDAQEGLKAFMEKRTPTWQNK